MLMKTSDIKSSKGFQLDNRASGIKQNTRTIYGSDEVQEGMLFTVPAVVAIATR